MAFDVRVYGYRGFKQIPTVLPKQFFSSERFGFWQPYEWREVIASNGATPVASAAQADPDYTQLLYVEIPAGSAIRYEVKPPGSVRVADANSPLMAASDWVPFEKGWTFEFIEG